MPSSFFPRFGFQEDPRIASSVAALEAAPPGEEQNRAVQTIVTLCKADRRLRNDMLFRLSFLATGLEAPCNVAACQASCAILEMGIKQDSTTEDTLAPLLNMLEPHTPPPHYEATVQLLQAWSKTKLEMTPRIKDYLEYAQLCFGDALEASITDTKYSCREEGPPDMSFVVNVSSALSALATQIKPA